MYFNSFKTQLPIAQLSEESEKELEKFTNL